MKIEKINGVVTFEIFDNDEVYGTDLAMISCILNADEVAIRFSSPEKKSNTIEIIEDGMFSVYRIVEDGDDYIVLEYTEA